ncbi:general transcription factor [Carpediemonas membranifera]|uniref:General transcription factor n=1 Tax=Carpediemonas membranifera TaxID=201153 RepID=A0A8J6B1F3_9EUKA|nr:general transcription factor [Carpediemonas membranifera]|eukprot:KAG9393618.1 general transcription factor [Carpediemonas membranifera]
MAEEEFSEEIIEEQTQYALLSMHDVAMKPFMAGEELDIANINTEKPLLRFRNRAYEGTLAESVGTFMAFTAPPLQNRYIQDERDSMKHVMNIKREIMATRVGLTEIHPEKIPANFEGMHERLMRERGL